MTPLSVRFLKVLSLGAVAGLALAACGTSSSQGTNLAADQTLKFPILDDFGTLDPAVADAETDQEIQQNMFNGLTKFDNNLNVVPDIAKSWTVSSDGMTYTFTMRQDVTFSNGDKVTAKDVLYSWNRAAAMSGAYGTSYGTNLSAIDGYSDVAKSTPVGAALEALLEKNDPSVSMKGLSAPDGPTGYTIVAKLAFPAGWFLPAISLTGSTGQLVDENVVKTDFDNWWTTNPVGTGPFKMTARVPKQSVDFAAVSNWWGSPKPTLTKVHVDVLNDASSAITKWEQGGYDIYGYGGYSNAPVADILRIQGTANEKSQLLLHPKVRTTWVSFNMVSDAKRQAKGPFTLAAGQSGHDLRLAFALAIDKTKLVSVVCQDIVCAPATGGLITKGLTGYLGDGQDPLGAFDAAKAKTLLKGADPDGSKTKGLTYTYDPENPLNKATAEFLQSQWQDNLGVHVELQAQSHSAFIKARLSGHYVMSRDGWQADYNHPQDWFDNLWGSALGCPDSSCTSGYHTDAYDALVKKADAESGDAALADYKKLSQMLIDDVVYIPLYYSVGAFLIHSYVQGAGTNNFVDYPWDGIQLLQH
jgi:oligopeptide transport system substrate-binding protein